MKLRFVVILSVFLALGYWAFNATKNLNNNRALTTKTQKKRAVVNQSSLDNAFETQNKASPEATQEKIKKISIKKVRHHEAVLSDDDNHALAISGYVHWKLFLIDTSKKRFDTKPQLLTFFEKANSALRNDSETSEDQKISLQKKLTALELSKLKKLTESTKAAEQREAEHYGDLGTTEQANN